MGFIETGYGYRLSQNLTGGIPKERIGQTPKNLPNGKLDPSSRPNETTGPTKSLNLNTAAKAFSSQVAPKYHPLTYQPTQAKPSSATKSTVTSDLSRNMNLDKKAKSTQNSIGASGPVSAKDYLQFFILKANHFKN